MREGPRLELRIDTKNPVELRQFVGTFLGIGNQFESHYGKLHGVTRGTAKFYVREVRKGSVIADLVPYFLPASGAAGLALAAIRNANDLISFAKSISEGIGFLGRMGGRLPNATKSELADYYNTVSAIAQDTDGSLSLAVYEDSEKRIAFQFGTEEARIAERNIVEQRMELDVTDDADHKRVLMSFVRTNLAHAPTGKKSGELVEIESIHSKALPIVYSSRLAEERIRHEVADADDNVFKKAFDVDVNVEMRGGKPIAYRLVAVHNVIDIPD